MKGTFIILCVVFSFESFAGKYNCPKLLANVEYNFKNGKEAFDFATSNLEAAMLAFDDSDFEDAYFRARDAVSFYKQARPLLDRAKERMGWYVTECPVTGKTLRNQDLIKGYVWELEDMIETAEDLRDDAKTFLD